MNYRRILEKGCQVLGERKNINMNNTPQKGLYSIVDTDNYTLYKYAYKADKVIAAYGDMVVVQKSRSKKDLVLYPYSQRKMIRYPIRLDAKTFPGLIPESEILSCQLIPYMREVDYHKYRKTVRLVVITTKAQIYHNYPARKKDIEGFSQPGDIVRFEESVVWDLPDRQYPSPEYNCKDFERYYPGLPKECYDYHPMLNDSKDFHDPYGNGGFMGCTEVEFEGNKRIAPRFYLYSRDVNANPFHFIGTGEREYKMSLMATYRSNVRCGVRTCLFASTDGGRNWYCKYEFADEGEYDFAQGDIDGWGKNYGNPVVDDSLRNLDWNGVEVLKRKLILPSEENKEPSEKFQWPPIGKILRRVDTEQLTLEFQEKHSLKDGNIIALCTNKNVDKKGWVFNNLISPVSSGNNMLFKVKVLSDRLIALYELVSSPSNNIPCRHIHHVNRIKDGWIFGTGEIFPNGWIFYLQMKEADTFAEKHAWEDFKIVRLNSSENSIQRTMGVILEDDEIGTLLYASDHDTLVRNCAIKIPGRDLDISRSSTGVFKGTISDIDDRNKFTAIFEAVEPCFYFQRLDNMLIFCGQRGEFAVSFDNGKIWSKERIPEPIIHYYGNCGQVYYFDTIVFVRK